MSQSTSDIRGVLIQVQGGAALLPNAVISEVLSYAPPEPVADAPDWLLGKSRWRGWDVPMISFARMAGLAAESPRLGNKVLVLKAFADDDRLPPYFAMLTQGFPRLVTVSREALSPVDGEGDAELPDAVAARVMLREDAALIPDLDRIQARLAEALAPAE